MNPPERTAGLEQLSSPEGRKGRREPLLAFLILAHHEPAMLARLVGRLRSERTCILIHVDAKADLAPFLRECPPDDQVAYLSQGERVRVHWGSYSAVEATLRLIRKALGRSSEIQNFCLLSGADYPVKSVQEMMDGLVPGREYIRVDRVLDPESEGYFDRLGHHLGLNGSVLTNPRTAHPLVSRVARRIERSFKLNYAQGPVYYGSSWWCLTRRAAEYVTGRDAVRKAAYFRYVNIPEEMVFQTLLKNAPEAFDIDQDVTAGPLQTDDRLNGVHYVDFSTLSSSPKTLTLEDLPEMRASGASFARKMAPGVSTALLDRLDREAEGRERRNTPADADVMRAERMVVSDG